MFFELEELVKGMVLCCSTCCGEALCSPLHGSRVLCSPLYFHWSTVLSALYALFAAELHSLRPFCSGALFSPLHLQWSTALSTPFALEYCALCTLCTVYCGAPLFLQWSSVLSTPFAGDHSAFHSIALEICALHSICSRVLCSLHSLPCLVRSSALLTLLNREGQCAPLLPMQHSRAHCSTAAHVADKSGLLCCTCGGEVHSTPLLHI